MPIEVIDNRSKLKKRQSYRSQRENTSEDSNGYDEADGMKHGGMKKKKMKKYSSGGMSKVRGTGCAIKGTKFKGIF